MRWMIILPLVSLAAIQPPGQFAVPEVGLTMTLPRGFVDYPLGRTQHDIMGCWIEEKPVGDTPVTLCVQRLGGTLERQPLTQEALGSSGLRLAPFKWNEFTVDGLESMTESEVGRRISLVTQVPLRTEAVQVILSGAASDSARVHALMTTTLTALVGETNWLTRMQRAEELGERFGYLIGGVLGLLLVLLISRWRARRRDNELEFAT